MRRSQGLVFLLLTSSFSFPVLAFGQTPPNSKVEARLTLMTTRIHEDDLFTVRAEVENVSDQTILVGRNINLISNFPIRMEIEVEDAAGNQIHPYHGLFVDSAVIADLELESGILKCGCRLHRTILRERILL